MKRQFEEFKDELEILFLEVKKQLPELNYLSFDTGNSITKAEITPYGFSAIKKTVRYHPSLQDMSSYLKKKIEERKILFQKFSNFSD